MEYPGVLVNCRFTGFLEEVYATLVVRLHHTKPFQQVHLWALRPRGRNLFRESCYFFAAAGM